MNEKVGKERLQKIDRFADSCAFSKALGNQAEFMKLIGNVISITKIQVLSYQMLRNLLRKVRKYLIMQLDEPHGFFLNLLKCDL